MAPRRIIAALIWMSAFPLLRIMGHLALQLPPKAAFAFHWDLIAQLRTKSLRRTVLKPLQVPTTLFRSDDDSSTFPDYGWRAQCSQLAVIPISGSHQTLFESPHCDILSARFLEAVESASATSLLVGGLAAGGALPLASVAPQREDTSFTNDIVCTSAID